MKRIISHLIILTGVILPHLYLSAQNPFISDQFTADPSARVFGNKVYVYPSHDILSNENRGRIGWFCMEDYHVFSSENLVDWTDHGMIVSQKNVEWVDPTSYSMWAPDCIERNGKYYFYFPTRAKDTLSYGKGFTIGVAVSDKPEGSFIPQPEPIKNVKGIDPNVFIDKDGQAYLYWSMGKIFVAKLNNNMLELDSDPMVIENLPTEGLIEGPFMFERDGTYYLTYPHVENKTERLEYAIGDNPMGPFTVVGVIMDESPTGCWTNHHSIIEFKNQWYLFYHHNDYSPQFDKSRSIRIDSLFFNTDGTIKKVIPTLRGVGLTDALQKIEIDRYSEKSEEGVTLAFLDSLNTFKGWKTQLNKKNAWIRYKQVDFRKKKIKTIQIKASSPKGALIEIRLNSVVGDIISEVTIPAEKNWSTVESVVKQIPNDIYDLTITLKNDKPVEIDWIRFLD